MTTIINQAVKCITVLFIIATLAACSGHRGPDYHAEKMLGFIAYKLDFTDEQEALLDDIHTEIKSIKEQTREQRKQQRDEFIALFEAEELNVEALGQLMEQHHDRMTEYAPRVMPLVKQLHATLSPEQKQKVLKVVSKYDDKH